MDSRIIEIIEECKNNLKRELPAVMDIIAEQICNREKERESPFSCLEKFQIMAFWREWIGIELERLEFKIVFNAGEQS